ncbi:RHS repeat domain-containing protein [Vibrio navarrensis]|uniref:RHS repeat domain-containing protein n=1 Tax=Vibrio navarrensis TaxID=29495 RepID=UPI0015595E36|nr:RHS repeat protein [Vibrio navarrensis]
MNEHDIGQLCQSTPTITVLDNRGLTVREVQFNRAWNNGVIGDLDIRITRHSYNAAGHLQTSIDPRFFAQLEEATTPEEKEQIPRNFSYITNLPGQQLRTDSIDAGSRITLTDVSGAPMLEWDERGTTRRFEYNDALHRPTTVIEQNDAINNGGEQVTERFVYGDSEPNASDNNLNGQLVRHYDNAGLREINSISLTNQSLSETRRLLLSDTGESDWQGGHEIEWEKVLEPDVADKRYTTSRLYNALGEVLQQTDAKGNRQRMTYFVSGRLQASYLTQAGESRDELIIVSGMEYSAHGQKLREVAGNGVISEYSYDDKTLHLSQVKTTRPAKARRTILLQDLRYRYDPVGNILKIQDKSVAPRFYKNQQVSAENHYEYDALYQLTKAKGRENDSSVQQSASLPTPKTPIPSDSSQYTNYTRSYRYDRGGNLTQIQHNGASRYTHIIVVSDKTNRAVQQRSNSEPQITPDQVDKHFDNKGNLQKLEHSKALTWGRSDQLKRVDITNQQQEHYQYSVQGQRIRKTLQDCANTQHQQVIYLPGLEIRRNYSTNQPAHTLTEELHVITVGQAGRAQVRVMHWESGKPVNEGEIPNDQLRYSLDNHLGSSYIELNQDADVLTREEYYPFGGTAVWSSKNQAEAKYKTIRYSGKERDATGLYYYGHRYYQSWAGRWLNPDPAGTVDGLNLFRMVRNNPVNFYDSEGLAPKKGVMYAPFISEDIVDMAYGKNLGRASNQKELYPVIVKDDSDKADFERIRAQKINEMRADAKVFTDIVQSNLSKGISIQGTRTLMGERFDTAASNSKMLLNDSDVLYKLVVLSNTSSSNSELSKLSPESNKLYILGHGLAGSRGLFANEDGTQGALSSETLVEQFVSSGLNKGFTDFRTFSCYSADTTKPASFSNEDLAKATKPKLSLGIIGRKKVIKQPLGQYLSDALYSHGFNNSVVTGYHGAGVMFSRTHHSRRLANSNVNDVRASTVKQLFRGR